MANPLTGEFDVVAEFSVPAVNRALAAQHQTETPEVNYWHSFRTYIPPTAEPAGSLGTAGIQVSSPTITLPEDENASKVTVHFQTMIHFIPNRWGAGRTVLPGADTLALPESEGARHPEVLAPTESEGAHHPEILAPIEPLVPTETEAVPTIPEFLHGEVRATVDISKTPSELGNEIKVHLDAGDAEITFTPAEGAPLTAGQLQRVNQLVRNFMQTGLEPVYTLTDLPEGGPEELSIRHWMFKSMPGGARPAIALLLNLENRRPTEAHRAGVTNIFLGGGDDFAIAISSNFLKDKLEQEVGDGIRQIDGQTFTTPWYLGWRTYTVSVREITVELQEGRIVASVGVNAAAAFAPDYDATLSQAFTLSVESGQVTLAPDGELDIEVDGAFSGTIRSKIREELPPNLINQIASEASPMIQSMLGGTSDILEALGIPGFEVTYTSANIGSDGVIVSGEVQMAEWQPVVATFTTTHKRHSEKGLRYVWGGEELEFNALNSWVPGSAIRQFEWSFGRSRRYTQSVKAHHQFILRLLVGKISGFRVVSPVIPPVVAPVDTPADSPADSPLTHPDTVGPLVVSRDSNFVGLWAPFRVCLSVSGTRQGIGVSNTTCAIIVPPPAITAEEPGSMLDGLVVPVGEVAHIDLMPHREYPLRTGGSGMNMVVHFTGSEPASDLRTLRDALAERTKKENMVFVVTVSPPGRADELGDLPGDDDTNVGWSQTEDFEGGWAKAFGVKEMPATYLVNPQGKVVWKQAGKLDAAKLVPVLNEHLVDGGQIRLRRLRLKVWEGRPAPDFLFEHTTDHQIALRKLRKRPVMLNFWKSWSKPCLEELHHLQKLHNQGAKEGLVILAINDGEDPQLSQEVFKRNGFKFKFVADADRRIAQSFGVNCWPTTVSINKKGIIQHVQFGVTPCEEAFETKEPESPERQR